MLDVSDAISGNCIDCNGAECYELDVAKWVAECCVRTYNPINGIWQGMLVCSLLKGSQDVQFKGVVMYERTASKGMFDCGTCVGVIESYGSQRVRSCGYSWISRSLTEYDWLIYRLEEILESA